MNKEKELQWHRLYNEVNSLGGDGAEFISAMQDLYSLYSDRIVDWFASLYDAEVGGFYFAHSAISADGYLPDIEATLHSLVFLSRFDGCENYADFVPDNLKKKIGYWVKGLQDPNGYFYHPQWDKDLTDKKLARKGRDLNYGLHILRSFGIKPTYDSPLGDKGDGVLPDGTLVKKISRPRSAYNKGTAKAQLEFPPHLESVDSFQKYLDEKYQELCERPYSMGNWFANQSAQIKSRDEMLRASGEKRSLCDMLIKWFDSRFNPETGSWYHPTEEDKIKDPRKYNYEGTNSLLKILDVYNALGGQIPDPMLAAKTAMLAIENDYPAGSVCDVYNTWYAVCQIIANIQNSSKGDEEKKRLIAKIRKELLKDAPHCIRLTKQKISPFLRSDGAFSFTPTGTSITSQGMPVALEGYDEGDTNATGICVGGVNIYIYSALGLTHVKPFSKEQLENYISLLESKSK